MRLLGSFFILCGIGVVGSFFFLQNFQRERVLLKGDKVFVVAQGESLHSVGRKLEAAGIISNARVFVKIGQLKGYDRIRFGEYLISSDDRMKDIYLKLHTGQVMKYEIVFTEGSHHLELARQLEEYSLIHRSKFLQLIRNKKFIKNLLGEEHASIEGYLFPDTYHFSKSDGEKKIIRTMVNRFFDVYDDLRVQGSALNRHELVTLASIIEKETGAGFERAKISSVFHNRMQKGMRLQTDPTVIYGNLMATGVEVRNITRKHLKTLTPYNTYLIPGLPPGPIGNPGEDALKAAFLPEATSYLYFVSQNDGTHVFTTNYNDHYAAVKKFQLNPKMRRGKSWRDLKKKNQKKQ